MKNLLTSFIFILLSLPFVSYSQEINSINNAKFKVGINAGYDRVLGNSEMQYSTLDTGSIIFKNGTGNGFHLGAVCSYQLSDFHSFNISINYEKLPFSYQTEGDKYPSLVDDPENPGKFKTVFTSVFDDLEINYSILATNILYKFSITNIHTGILIGLNSGIVMKKHQIQKIKGIEPFYVHYPGPPGVIRYEDNDRTWVLKDEDIPNASSFRLGLKFGIEYELKFDRFNILPGIYYDRALTKVTSDNNWYKNYFQAGISILYSL
jgi:hypothetical protein